MKNSTDWFKEWFASDFYQIVYKHRDNNDAGNFLELILSKIHIPKNSLILDAACGAGRHLKFLHEIGYTNVFGFDLSLTLLKSAKLNNVQNIICADIRKAFFKVNFDLILNIFTSFGYFDNDVENFLFFYNAKKFLKPNGIIVFDYFNSNYLLNNLVLESKSEIEDIVITEKRKIEKGRVEKLINITNNQTNFEFKESVKLYSYEFLIRKFNDLGYKINGIYGNYKGDIFDINKSDRVILFLENA